MWPPRFGPNRNSFGKSPLILPSVLNAAKNQLTEFIFPSNIRRTTTTTQKPITTTKWPITQRPFEQENVSPRQPTTNGKNDVSNQNQNQENAWSERSMQTTSEMPNWMQLVLDEHSTSPKPSAQTNQVNTTPEPVRTTTINSFWNEWSATNPAPVKNNSNFNHGSSANKANESNANMRQTTTERMPNWMKEIFDEYTTTARPTTTKPITIATTRKTTTSTVTTTKADMLPWMQDILNEYSTTAKSSMTHSNQAQVDTQTTTAEPDTEAKMPSCMRDVLNEVSTTTTVRSTVVPVPLVASTTQQPTFINSSSFIGDGSGDLHVSTQNRYSMCESLCLSISRIHCSSWFK